MELRNMQVETNFIRRNATSGLQQCIRSSKIYDAIVCPPGHFRRREEEVLAGCEMAGLPCAEGFQCICRPCVKSFDVDVFPVLDDGSLVRGATDADGKVGGQTTTSSAVATAASVEDDEESPLGCEKMGLCGSVEQGKAIRFRAVDNKKRPGIGMSVFVHAGQSKTREIQATPIRPAGNETESFVYEFVISEPNVGVVVLEILADGEQIPESPLRLEVTPRNCAADNDDPLSVAQADGSCSCAANAVDIGGQCVSFAILLPAIILPVLAIAAVIVFFYIKQKHKAADSVWHVKEKELEFEDPPKIIGRGTFGLVLMAEYRGTQVAVKRVIPPKQRRSPASSGTSSQSISKRYSFLPTGGRSRDSIINPGATNRLASLEGIEEAEDESRADSSHGRKMSSPSRKASDMSLLSESEPDGGHNDSTTSFEPETLARRSSDGGTQKRRSSLTNPLSRRGSNDVSDDKQKRRLSAYNTFGMTGDDIETGKSSGDFNGNGSGAFHNSGNFSSDGLGSGVIGNASGGYDASSIFGTQSMSTPSTDALASMSMQISNGRGSAGRRSNGSGSSGGKYSGPSAKKGNWLLRTIGLASKDEYSKLKADFIVEMRHLSKCEFPLSLPLACLTLISLHNHLILLSL